MSLKDKLEKLEISESFVTVAGVRFRIARKSLLDGSEIGTRATIANKKRKETGQKKLPVDAFWLEACVSDAEDGSTLTASEWAEQPRRLTSPLVVAVMQDNGLDDEDIERDPNGSSTTET